jgi:hypothetical protein
MQLTCPLYRRRHDMHSCSNLEEDVIRVLCVGCALLQKTAVEYAALAEEYQTAFNAFQTKYHGKKRYTFLVPAMGLMQAGLFISQFSAIMTLASAKVGGVEVLGICLVVRMEVFACAVYCKAGLLWHRCCATVLYPCTQA